MGYLIDHSPLMNVLRVFKADQDEHGKFFVRGNITSFMGVGEEWCVGDDAEFRIGGEWRSLPRAISATSYGVPVTVI